MVRLNRKPANLSQKLTLKVTLLSLLGLVIAFFVVNTFVRNELYNNIIASSQNNMIIYATELNSWFTNSLRVLDTMAAAFEHFGDEHIRNLSLPFANAHDHISIVFVGFADENLSR